MGDIGRNKGKYERFGKPLQERARLNTISWDFSKGEINLGILEMPCTSQKTTARTTQLAQRLEKKKNSKNQKPIKTDAYHREFFGGKEIWKNMRGSENHYRKEPG